MPKYLAKQMRDWVKLINKGCVAQVADGLKQTIRILNEEDPTPANRSAVRLFEAWVYNLSDLCEFAKWGIIAGMEDIACEIENQP